MIFNPYHHSLPSYNSNKSSLTFGANRKLIISDRQSTIRENQASFPFSGSKIDIILEALAISLGFFNVLFTSLNSSQLESSPFAFTFIRPF